MFVWGLLVVKLCVKVCLFVLNCRGAQTFIFFFYFVVVFCWRCGPDIVFFVVDPCCCKTRNMNGCLVFVVVVPILGFIFVMF